MSTSTSMRVALGTAVAAALVASAGAQTGGPIANPSAVRPGPYKLDKGHAKVDWYISHLGFSSYTGEFTAFDAELVLDPARPERGSLNVTLDAASVETNNDTLDGHLRSPQFLNVARFPTATFRSTRIERTGERTARVVGDLTLHGVTRQVPFAVTFNASGANPVSKAYTVGFTATAEIDRTAFGVSTYAPALGSTVKLTINSEFNPAQAS